MAPEHNPTNAPQEDALAALCRRWGVAELALFGSIVRDDFGPSSDADVLVTFLPSADRRPDREAMRRELERLLGRPVDIVYRRVIEHDPNYIIRRAILDSAQVIYAA